MHLQDLGCGVKGSENPFIKVEIIIDNYTNNAKKKKKKRSLIQLV